MFDTIMGKEFFKDCRIIDLKITDTFSNTGVLTIEKDGIKWECACIVYSDENIAFFRSDEENEKQFQKHKKKI